jgi:AraC-like DNA-binding protein
MEGQAFVTFGAVLVAHTKLKQQTMHQHRPFELIASIDGAFRLMLASGAVIETSAAIVPPMTRHALLGYSGRIIRIYLDPGKRSIVLRWLRVETVNLRDELVMLHKAFFETDPTLNDARAIIASWRTEWAGSMAMMPACDARVARVLEFLDDQTSPAANRHTVSRLVGLSPSRFAALFAADVGMSIRRYINWRRVLIAARLIRSGESLTRAAQQAGFADSGHMTRSYRKAFGSAPSQLCRIEVRQRLSSRHVAG